jgi:multidrug transporter EmrE-like cation transporter
VRTESLVALVKDCATLEMDLAYPVESAIAEKLQAMAGILMNREYLSLLQ